MMENLEGIRKAEIHLENTGASWHPVRHQLKKKQALLSEIFVNSVRTVLPGATDEQIAGIQNEMSEQGIILASLFDGTQYIDETHIGFTSKRDFQ